jgi:flavin-binding protein dodecin
MSSVVKVIEVIAESDQGFDDAVRNAVKEAAKTVSGIKSIWVENLSAKVDANRITSYRANCKLSFVLKGRA